MQGTTLPLLWLYCLAVVVISSCQARVQPNADDWKINSFLRTIDLGGSVTILSEVHGIRAGPNTLEPKEGDEEPRLYYFAFSQSDASKLSTIEVTAKYGAALIPAHRAILAVQDQGALDGKADVILNQYLQGTGSNGSTTSTRPHLYSVKVPAAFLQKAHEAEEAPEITITINTLLLHTSEALPPSVGQKDNQFLLWSGDASPIALYDVEKARVKVK